MNFHNSVGPVLIVVAYFSSCCGCHPSPSIAGNSGDQADAGGAWDVGVSRDGKILIRHKGATVVQAGYVFWGQAWKYAGARLEVEPAGDGVYRLKGEVADLGLKIVGEMRNPKPDVLQIDYQVRAASGLDHIMGGGIEWRLKLDSPAFGARSPDPELLDGKLGWRWRFAGGRELVVKFSEAIPSVGFEQNQKSTIRTMFVGSKLDPGTRSFTMTVQLPPGGRLVPPIEERYGPAETGRWYRDALRWDTSPVDLSDLNAKERPAGRRGFVVAKGDQLIFADGTPARFWGGNIAAYALFTSKPEIAGQARRISQLGFNLMRIHHQDSMRWVKPTSIEANRQDSKHLDAAAMDKIDWWIKCLKDEGVYIWLDLHVGRQFKAGDGIGPGFDEIQRAQGEGKGFNYLNPRVRDLMAEMNAAYLSHVNRYTGLAYKDDPAIMAVLITNENDMTQHGHFALPDKNNPVHSKIFMSAAKEFAAATGLPSDKTWRTWEAGPSKIFLNDLEHQFNRTMIQDLRKLGVRIPIATTNFWGNDGLYSLPALTDGDIIDVHSYGDAEALSVNPRYEANYLSWIATAQVAGKPLTITEWNVPYPLVDRFTAPMYVASIASLQGWDAPMVYNYSQTPFRSPGRGDQWSTFFDPAIAGAMPAAAIAFRKNHISLAKETYSLNLGRDQLFQNWNPTNAATIRTLTERSRLVIGLPDTKELSWDHETTSIPDAKVVTDPNHDYIPPGQNFVESDTGELRRDWERGVQTINTPKTQAVLGWVGGESISLKDVSFRFETKKVAATVTSLDDRPIASSRKILITTLGRVVASPGGKTPLLSEPVTGEIKIRTSLDSLQLVSLGADGRENVEKRQPRRENGFLVIALPTQLGTHWFLLRERSTR
jgi:hypothetical protein